MSQSPTITDAELLDALAGPTIQQCTWSTDATEGPAIARSQWVDSLATGGTPALPLDVLLDVASEVLPEGTLATIQALLRGLILRHEGDDATVAALVAIERLHLPNLLA
jgi:hypothetical protein